MKAHHIAIAIALLTFAGHAVAFDSLSSGGVFGGPAQRQVYCYLFNAGPTTVRLRQTAILDQQGTVLATGSGQRDECLHIAPGFLNPDDSCVIRWTIPAGTPLQTYSCKSVFADPAKNIRGTLSIRDQDDNVLASVPLIRGKR